MVYLKSSTIYQSQKHKFRNSKKKVIEIVVTELQRREVTIKNSKNKKNNTAK